MASICSAVAIALAASSAASAQSNPFVPPQGGGMSRAQIQEIVRQEVERAKAAQARAAGTVSAPGGQPGVASAVNATKQQAPGSGAPVNTAAGGAPGAPSGAAAAQDAVADLLKDGGVFVGCVSGTPVFKDKVGRRAYFTTKELRESNEARRFTRCR